MVKPFSWFICLSLLASNTSANGLEVYVVDIGPNRSPPWQVLKYDGDGQNPEVESGDPTIGHCARRARVGLRGS